MRVVIDTGVLVSGLIRPQGTIGEVLRALRNGRFVSVYSTAMMVEMIDVLGRSPFRTKYHIQPNDIAALINLIRLRGELVFPQRKITACRDPKDNKFLEAALAGQTEILTTGDADLLILNPFENIDILRPAEFLARL
jgi:putative PIN family toxin of toxin-antitoxin system